VTATAEADRPIYTFSMGCGRVIVLVVGCGKAAPRAGAAAAAAAPVAARTVHWVRVQQTQGGEKKEIFKCRKGVCEGIKCEQNKNREGKPQTKRQERER